MSDRTDAARNADIRIAFIASREPSYPRVAITLQALEDRFEVMRFVSSNRHYLLRIVSVWVRFIWAWGTGQLRKTDLLYVGFFAQPVLPLVRCCWRGPLISDGFISLFDTFVRDKARAGERSLAGRVCRWLDRFMLQTSNVVLADTSAHGKFFEKEYGVGQADVRRVFASAQADVFSPRAALAYSGEAPFEVLFWGAFIPLQGVDVILHAAHQLDPKRFHFTIVGEGQTADSCHSLARRLDLKNVSFLGWQQLTALVELSEQAHLLLGIFGTTDKAARVIPNKAFQALALAKPLITGDSPATRELLCHNQDAILVPLGDPAALAERIVWSAANYDEAVEIGERGYATFSAQASLPRVSDEMEKIVHSVLCLTGDR